MFERLKGSVRDVGFYGYLTKREKIFLITLLSVSYSIGMFLSWYLIGLYGVDNGKSFFSKGFNLWVSLQIFWEKNPVLLTIKMFTYLIFYGCIGYLFLKKILKKE